MGPSADAHRRVEYGPKATANGAHAAAVQLLASLAVAESCASALYAVCSVMYLRSRQFFVMNSSVQQKSKAESETSSHNTSQQNRT